MKKQAEKKPKRKVSVEQVLKVVPGSGGILTQIAKKAGICRSVLWIYCNENPILQKAIDDEKEVVLDACEYGLIKKIYEQDIDAIKYYLARKGQSRGYSDSMDIKAQVALSKGIELNIIKPSDEIKTTE